MNAPRAARSAAPAPGPGRLTGFDATNLAGAIEQLETAQGSLDAIRPRDPQLAK